MDRTTHTPDDALSALTAAAAKCAAHPGVAAPLRALLPALVDELQRQAQELRELRRPCPCEAADAPRRDGWPPIDAAAAIEHERQGSALQLGGDGFPLPAIAV
jgi:hypothetical protein